MNKRGFTLIELIVVVIVIGILATFAVPQYLKAVTRARVAKAKNALALVSKAEKLYRAKNDAYIACADTTAVVNMGTAADIELNDLSNDTDWSYDVSSAATTFTATATGKAGTSAIAGKIISVTESGAWTIAPELQ